MYLSLSLYIYVYTYSIHFWRDLTFSAPMARPLGPPSEAGETRQLPPPVFRPPNNVILSYLAASYAVL